MSQEGFTGQWGRILNQSVRCRFPGDDIPIVRGSALAALKGENDALGKQKILELMQAVDDYVPTPARALDKPFSMPVEDVFSIQVKFLVNWHSRHHLMPREPHLVVQKWNPGTSKLSAMCRDEGQWSLGGWSRELCEQGMRLRFWASMRQ